MTGSALLLATAPAADAPAAALLQADGEPLAARLLAQLATLGVGRAWVIARPDAAPALRDALAGGGVEAEVVACADLGADLRAVAGVARRASGTLVVVRADLLLHREALAGLLAMPTIPTGILATESRDRARGEWWFGVREQRGRVLSAGSPYHRVSAPSGRFVGVLKVDARDAETLADGALRLAALWPPAGDSPWAAELRSKLAAWQDGGPGGDAGAGLLARVAGEDAVSLLLVALVRGGAHVGNADLRGFFCAQPRSRAGAAAAAERLRGTDEDKLLLDAAVKSSDGFFTTFFVSPYSRHIARFAARRGWTPNAMTTLSMVIGTGAAAAFATGGRAGLVAGAVLLQAAFTIDCVDGQLARYTRRFSRFGAWLDSIFDRGKEYVVYAGLALGSMHGFDRDVWTLAACALTLQTARHAVDFSWGALRHQAIATAPQLGLETPADLEGTQRPVREIAAEAPRAAARGGIAARGVGIVVALERWTATRWLKRILTLPIGERFALISLTAALGSPHLTFVALLAWGGFAAAYQVGGRLLRSVAA
ncbi:MAG TPA: CDP-alcohol phosphatidyltransferase family protein [Solirubrobacteraceae bacterium]|nr:CDP-alcohol phosphatidyltransferase family protein [Solirubrobacteraceae bacterium]